MSERRFRNDGAQKAAVLTFDQPTVNSQTRAEELLSEIDNLAILLDNVKRQTEKIEAAADAIGDRILSHLEKERVLTQRPPAPSLRKTSARLRGSSPRSSQAEPGQRPV